MLIYEYYKKPEEKGQGSEADMARLKRVREESMRDLGMLLIIEFQGVSVVSEKETTLSHPSFSTVVFVSPNPKSPFTQSQA
ncbi:hypothetical protein PIB30_033158 [Stylosanthes scabra]|uniref:Uncharacterized protein n=1 Tax=Stylosanthes scabra TaxID=79078 RepID=A0ABU6Y9M4_9FABA|nr:hypothetical protein [Stylosanthes scabra]